jgi:cytochrome bd-type quinol oxidase subunit 2
VALDAVEVAHAVTPPGGMKRSHRSWHRWAWLLLAPAVVAVLVLALLWHVNPPVNAELPAFLIAPISPVAPVMQKEKGS